MNTLQLNIGGRTFAIAVQPGQEDHVHHLASQIDAKFQQLTPRYSQNLLFATLQLADELHRSQLASAQAKQEAQAAVDGASDLKREADMAVGQTDKLKRRIAELEEELSNLQSSIQQESNKYNDLIADNERFKIAVMEADTEKTRLQGELASARRERDALEQQLAEAPAAASGQQAFFDPASSAIDPELVPALERFAELLENCASKLEGKGAAS
ncbi:cell division protein ZapA [Erythrobacter sp. SDW2]|uniref:cell division protein ZapA n=1 Tax=Erythrobacter sp. SDW2 TaxID=2907154 RepID=UPI001F01E636|nr:cell division protein ZapA [Erythrobacter sp. SDW2]UIP05949.1 cell division protein ZapA [Erythrobacter sp. SDW2]